MHSSLRQVAGLDSSIVWEIPRFPITQTLFFHGNWCTVQYSSNYTYLQKYCLIHLSEFRIVNMKGKTLSLFSNLFLPNLANLFNLSGSQERPDFFDS